MKYKIFILLDLILIAVICLSFFGDKLNYLSVFLPHIEKSQPAVQSNPQPKVTSQIIYGVNVDMSQLIPTSSHYVVNSKGQDLIDIAHHLGVNLFRITSVTPAFGQSGFIYTKAQWDLVLNKMNANGIKALILIESPSLNSNDFSQNYLNLVQSYVLDSGALDNPDVYGVDIRNEPLLNSNNISVLLKASKMIKTNYPKMLVTVGGWKTYNPGVPQNSADAYIWMSGIDGKKLSSIVDFYSIHTYDFDKTFLGVYPDPYNLTLYQLNKVLPILNDKPVLIEEFGAGDGDALTDQQTIGSSQLQANTYDGVYQAVIDLRPQGVLGSVAYVFTNRNPNVTADGWAIIKNNGNYLYPAAYVLQKYALGTSDATLNLPLPNIPNDFLLTNSDNNQTINVKLNDVIGLHLNLSQAYTNSISVSNPLILLKSEPLTRPDNGNYIDAVFHAQKIGKSQIKILGRDSEGAITRFTANINVTY